MELLGQKLLEPGPAGAPELCRRHRLQMAWAGPQSSCSASPAVGTDTFPSPACSAEGSWVLRHQESPAAVLSVPRPPWARCGMLAGLGPGVLPSRAASSSSEQGPGHSSEGHGHWGCALGWELQENQHPAAWRSGWSPLRQCMAHLVLFELKCSHFGLYMYFTSFFLLQIKSSRSSTEKPRGKKLPVN